MTNAQSTGRRGFLERRLPAFLFAALLCAAAAPALAERAQQSFASPEQAAEALFAANQANDKNQLLTIFGSGGGKLVGSGDPVADRHGRARFAAAYGERHEIEQQGADKAVLLIGAEEWPFPIPLVRAGDGWRFDTKAGREEILNRRIGRNELNAIEVSRAFVEAEREYHADDPLGDGSHEYTQHFVSRKDKHDGLYWPVAAGEKPSPMGPLIANARAEGYGARKAKGKPAPYHGYYYKILTRQGPHAPGGAQDYVVDGHLVGGFALVAFPAKYGASGVMTFVVNQQGVVYQRNLGRDAAAAARAMTAYDPDDGWTPVP
ncbi:MAG: DUF2950 domain-containing protein [Stellaceae bacterium]